MKLSQRDKQLIWHPFTQQKTASEVMAVKRAQGAYIYDENDKPYLDLISSWWVNLHGHAHTEIARHIHEQALQLEHVLFAGCTHEPAVQLCEELTNILPSNLRRFFFSDNGSTAIEVALKMAYQYWRNLGDGNKTMFLSFAGGYHGDTFGAMAVGSSGFHDHFVDLFFKVLNIPYPDTWDNDDNIEAKEQHALSVLEQHLLENGNNIAALIIEPLIQGASGMRICRAEFINQVIKAVKRHDILVIFDEVMTGFGRTGSYFALEQLAETPDMLCISKGITGGFLPLAITIATDHIYQAFLSDNIDKAFLHGHSYTANPIACSSAIASLRLLMNADCQQTIKDINQAHQLGIKLLNEQCSEVIEKTRILGTISAFEIKDISQMPSLKLKFLERGLLLRPLGKVVYLLPPYCVTQEELKRTYAIIAEILVSMS